MTLNMTAVREGKYRFRTRLRGHLPRGMVWIAPKGRRDCGDHEWYLAAERTWRCYHCRPAVTHESPFSPEQEARYRHAALLESLRLLSFRPLTPETVREERELLAELSETVERERQLLSA